jgi:hypothetical protein
MLRRLLGYIQSAWRKANKEAQSYGPKHRYFHFGKSWHK